jgi:hypothetical protein
VRFGYGVGFIEFELRPCSDGARGLFLMGAKPCAPRRSSRNGIDRNLILFMVGLIDRGKDGLLFQRESSSPFTRSPK